MACTQQQQLICFPRVRVQKKWFRYFNDHKDFRNEGTLHLFSLMSLFSYANFRSRMSGNAEEGFAAYEDLYNKGVNLVFLKEPHINTDTYKKALENNIALTGSSVDLILEGVNRYLMELAKEQIRLAFVQSEKEVSDLHQRTKEGIATARLNGKQIGRQKNAQVVTKKSIKAKEIIKRVSRDFDGNLTDAEVIELVGIARNTYYKYKKELYASEQEAENKRI